jgi:magnesium chelatase family protein
MGNGPEAAWAGELRILATPSLIALVNHMKGTQVLSVPSPRIADDARALPDLKDVKGQESAKRALEMPRRAGIIC